MVVNVAQETVKPHHHATTLLIRFMPNNPVSLDPDTRLLNGLIRHLGYSALAV